MVTKTPRSTADADDSSGEPATDPLDGNGVRLEGEVISKRPSLAAALSLLPSRLRNGARHDDDVEPSDDG